MLAVDVGRDRADIADVYAIRRKLPPAWRIAAAVAVLAAAAAATSEVPRKHGVPLFLAFIVCGALLRFWALGIWSAVVAGFIVEQAIAGRFYHWSVTGNGDNLGAEWALGVLVYAGIGAAAIMCGIGLAAVLGVIRSPPRAERGDESR
jgi:hypothetical protein